MLASNTVAVLPPGALIDPEIFEAEVAALGLSPERVIVSPFASLISAKDKESERLSGLSTRIGSTGSGSGAALVRRIQRTDDTILARCSEVLQPFLKDTGEFLRNLLVKGGRVVIEGSQGFGLSVLHNGYYPKATSRDTTAAAFVSEAGLSPFDVDDIALVVRAFPIRVAGDSGELYREITWKEIATQAGLPSNYHELTTATRKVRRVGTFDAALVRRAIDHNQPTRIVLNHFDYVEKGVRFNTFSVESCSFLEDVVEKKIGRRVDLIGTGPNTLLDRRVVHAPQRYSHTA